MNPRSLALLERLRTSLHFANWNGRPFPPLDPDTRRAVAALSQAKLRARAVEYADTEPPFSLSAEDEPEQF